MHKDIIHGANMINRLRLTYPNMDSQVYSLSYAAIYAARINKEESFEKFQTLVSGATMDVQFMNQVYERYKTLEDFQEWDITGQNESEIFIKKDDIRAYIRRDIVENKYKSLIGETMLLNFPLIELYRQPGFIVRKGKYKMSSDLLTRIYLNIKPTHVDWVYGYLANLLDQTMIPFFLKTLSHPKMYLRCDSCVVYVESEDLMRTIILIKKCIKDQEVSLTNRIPLMTQQIVNGVGIADEPSDLNEEGQSFGQWVSSLFAINSVGITNPEIIATKVENAIVETGRNPDLPYLRAGRTIDLTNI